MFLQKGLSSRLQAEGAAERSVRIDSSTEFTPLNPSGQALSPSTPLRVDSVEWVCNDSGELRSALGVPKAGMI